MQVTHVVSQSDVVKLLWANKAVLEAALTQTVEQLELDDVSNVCCNCSRSSIRVPMCKPCKFCLHLCIWPGIDKHVLSQRCMPRLRADAANRKKWGWSRPTGATNIHNNLYCVVCIVW